MIIRRKKYRHRKDMGKHVFIFRLRGLFSKEEAALIEERLLNILASILPEEQE